MQSRFSEAVVERRESWVGDLVSLKRRARGFTLIELMIVLVIAGLIVSLVAGSIGDVSLSRRQSGTMRALTRYLMMERAEAMRRSQRRVVSLIVDDETGELVAASGGVEKRWEAAGLVLRGRGRTWEEAEWDPALRREGLVVEIGGLGRTDERLVVFDGRDPADGGGGGGKMWVVRFDALSGAVSLSDQERMEREARERRGRR